MTAHRPQTSIALLSISGGYARLLLDWLNQQQLSPNSLHAQILALPRHQRVSALLWQNWLLEAEALTPRPISAGLEIGRLIDVSHMGLLGHLVQNTATLSDALMHYQSFEALQYGQSWMQLEERETYICLSWQVPKGLLAAITEMVALTSFYYFVEKHLSLHHAITGIVFTQKHPHQLQDFTAFFHCPLTFNGTRIEIHISHQAQHQSISHFGSQSKEKMLKTATQVTNSVKEDNSFIHIVQEKIQHHLHEGGSLASKVALSLQIAPRTLQLRLSQTHWTFQQLVDTTRQHAAAFYLSDPNLSYIEITFLLGFSEQSVFNKAFKTWFGCTPSQWRTHHSSSTSTNIRRA